MSEELAPAKKRFEGPHGQRCVCLCHDAPYCPRCDECWTDHIPPDGCLECARVVKATGRDPVDGNWYLELVFWGTGHDQHWTTAHVEAVDVPQFSFGGSDYEISDRS